MSKVIIESKNAPAPIGPYSQAVFANNVLYISGQIAIIPGADKIENSDIKSFISTVKKSLDRSTNSKKKVITIYISESETARMTSFPLEIHRYCDMNPNEPFVKDLKLEPTFFADFFKQISRAWAGRSPNISDYERILLNNDRLEPSAVSRMKKKIVHYNQLVKNYNDKHRI